jgi:serine/threonine protein kinase
MQILKALEYVHANKVAHCDIKIENVLYDDVSGKVTLIDFGGSVKLEEVENCESRDIFCTPAYLAPEQIASGKLVDLQKTDVWALGVLLFKMATGLFPFRAKTEPDLKKKILKGEYSVPSTVSLSIELRQLLLSLLSTEERRPRISEITSDPWLLDN